jgi:anthranilate synthase component 2
LTLSLGPAPFIRGDFYLANAVKILIVDNYDSFTYNLVHLVSGITGAEIVVVKNDEIVPGETMGYDRVILSPGPGIPAEAGRLLDLIRESAGRVPVLGVCLGHQAIGQVYGAQLTNLDTVFHGVATKVEVEPEHRGKELFRGLPDVFDTGRYHSWIVSDDGFPPELEVTARDENGYIMAMKHRHLDLQSVQFHPESVLTPLGEKIMANWLKPD